MMKPVLYAYFRSSASYRVRIALNLKGIDYELRPVHLARDGGEQHAPAYKALNPQELVPLLEIGNQRIAQSLAIIEYLDETHPRMPLLPADPAARAFARQLALLVACDIAPLGNLRVLNYLTDDLGCNDVQRHRWLQRWIGGGLQAFEALLAARERHAFCLGEAPGLAECFLVPQLFNARRFDVDLQPFPILREIDTRCASLPAFQRAHPKAQPDAE